MEPLSVTASILTLLGAGGRIARALKKLSSLKSADVLYALSNEVEDLRLVITEVDDLLQSAAETLHQQPPASLERALERVKYALLELERYIAYELTIQHGEKARVDKSVYMRAEGKLQSIQESLRKHRQDLRSAIACFNLYKSPQHD